MNPYNGFPPSFRHRQGQALNDAFRDGVLARPIACELCELQRGDGATIHAHLEDYHRIETFVGLCFCCHMGLHRRYSEPDVWSSWLASVEALWTPPVTAGYTTFIGAWWGQWKRPIAVAASAERRRLPAWVAALPDVEPDLYRPDPDPILFND